MGNSSLVNLDSSLAVRAHELFERQLVEWPMMRAGAQALKTIQTRTIDVGEFSVRLQFNPGRIVSSGAKVDAKSIQERACFLCGRNLPPEQRAIEAGDYDILCNPFPIFPEHFTIAHRAHQPQRIAGAIEMMLALAEGMSPRYTVFYNGPRCGASAPDHLHFQAGDRAFMPIEADVDRLKGSAVFESGDAGIYIADSLRPFIAVEGSTADGVSALCKRLVRSLASIVPSDDEPMMNMLAWHEPKRLRVVIFPRMKHRPSFYFADGDARILLSPASVDLGGVCILPVERDFDRLDADDLRRMFAEVMPGADAMQTLRGMLLGEGGNGNRLEKAAGKVS